MPFSALSIKDHAPRLGQKYVFDANVWIYILEADLDLSNKLTKAGPYVDFLEQIIKAGSPKPKVVLPAFILSEVVNRLLRSYYFPLFIEEHKTIPFTSDQGRNYKHLYRPHDRFRIDYSMILYGIKAYHNVIELVSDEFNQLRVKDVFNNPDVSLDFNDYLLVELAKRNDYIIVSEDADLKDQDVTVATSNRKMLNP